MPLTYSDIQNCPDFHFYAKILLLDGKVSNPFFAKAPTPAVKVRDYDNFVERHRSGRFTVDEIENELENRLDRILVLNKLLNK